MSFSKLCKKPFYGVTKYVGRHNPELLVKIRYFFRFKKPLNLTNPQTLNEKILYLSLRTDTSLWTRLADKYEVREYVKQCNLEHLLVKLYSVWDNAKDICFDNLPKSFVLKSNNGSGDVIIVKDKSQIDTDKTKKKLAHMLCLNYGELEGGKHYMRIPHKIIAEEYIENDSVSEQYSTSLIDYKIWCFNGKASYVWTCCNRDKNGTDVMTFDTEWNAHPEYCRFTSHYRRGPIIPRPKNLEVMLQNAERLAEGFPVVRVDLYNLDGKIYFGEMTFTSLGGLMDFYSDDFQKMAGNLITL